MVKRASQVVVPSLTSISAVRAKAMGASADCAAAVLIVTVVETPCPKAAVLQRL